MKTSNQLTPTDRADWLTAAQQPITAEQLSRHLMLGRTLGDWQRWSLSHFSLTARRIDFKVEESSSSLSGLSSSTKLVDNTKDDFIHNSNFFSQSVTKLICELSAEIASVNRDKLCLINELGTARKPRQRAKVGPR